MDENTSDRFGSFFDRVQTERTALKIINEVFDSRKLHGLTEAAINSWFADALRNEKGGAPIKEIASILKRLSSRIDALADQSRTVFSDERFPLLPSEEILQELALTCRRLSN